MLEKNRRRPAIISDADILLGEWRRTDSGLSTSFSDPQAHKEAPEQTAPRRRASDPEASPGEHRYFVSPIRALHLGPLTFANRWDSVMSTLGSTTVTGIGTWISVQTAVAGDLLHLFAGVAVTLVGLGFMRDQVRSGDLSWARSKKSSDKL